MNNQLEKNCIVCNSTFTKPKNYSYKQFELRTACSKECANKQIAITKTGQKQSLATRRLKSKKQKLLWQDAKVRQKRQAGIRSAYQQETVKNNHKAALRKYFDNPDNRQAILDRIARANKTKFTPNPHRTRGDVTYIYFANDKGFTKVDTADYEDLARYRWVYMTRGYAEATINGKRTLLHRYLMKPEGRKEVDHINNDRLDNRRINLRIATRAENARNVSRGKSNTSGYKGVHHIKGLNSYRAVIWVDNKRVHLGYFKSIEDAAKAYNEAAEKYHGDYAKLNKEAGNDRSRTKRTRRTTSLQSSNRSKAKRA